MAIDATDASSTSTAAVGSSTDDGAGSSAPMRSAPMTCVSPASVTGSEGCPNAVVAPCARVMLFYQTERDLPDKHLWNLLHDSYNEDPLFTLRFVAFLRDPRGGRKERKLGRRALVWLAQCLPSCLVQNLSRYLDQFGRFDDFVELIGTKVEREVLEFIAQQLRSDLHCLKQGNDHAISLCAKWVPNESRQVYSRIKKQHVSVHRQLAKYMGLKSADLRKIYLSPLRRALNLVETAMSEKRYQDIRFGQVPCKTMLYNGRPYGAFERNAQEEFRRWKTTRDDDVQHPGTSTTTHPVGLHRFIPSSRYTSTSVVKNNSTDSVLEPSEILHAYHVGGWPYPRTERPPDGWLEAQWNRLVQVTKKSQKGSMVRSSLLLVVTSPMVLHLDDALVGCAMLLADLAQHPLGKLVMTLGAMGTRHVELNGPSLHDRVGQLQNMEIGCGCDLPTAMNHLLEVALNQKLAPTEMPQRLVVLTDFSPVQLQMPSRKTIEDFVTNGYEMLHVLVWNTGGTSASLPKPRADFSYLRWFSMDVLKTVLHSVRIDPLTMAEQVVMGPRYEGITLTSTGSTSKAGNNS